MMDSPLDVQRKMRDTLWISVVEGSFTQVFLNLTAGGVLTGYMLFLGATPTQLAAVASVPLLAQVVGPISAWLAARVGNRKLVLALTSIPGRGLWLGAVLLPLLGLPPSGQPTFLVGLVAVSCLFQAGTGPAWISLMADVVPPAIRGRYFGLRSGILGVVGMAATLGAGLYLDRAAPPAGFQMVLTIALLCALVGIFLYSLHYEPPTQRIRVPLREIVAGPLRDANFRKFMLFSMYWNGAVMLAAPFVIPYFFKHLHLSFTQIAIWSAIASICSLATGPLWGRIADRVGHKAVLSITTFLAGSAHPLCWMLATPGRMAFIWISGVVDALSWGGIHTALFNLSIATAPRAMRTAYVAVLGMANGLVGFAAGLLSGPLLEMLLPWDFFILGFHWTGYHTLFLISGVLRMQAWRLLRPVAEANAWRTRDVLRAIRDWSLHFVTGR